MPLTAITHEKNSQRKAHRIDIPIKLIIENNIFYVKNWSVSGVGIELTPEQKIDFNIGDVVKASIVLLTGESSIVLDIEITIKNKSDNYYGAEITKISDKNKRVLRHYASLAIDGNVNKIDDLSGNLFMQNVESPISEPISLSEKEEKKIKRSFLKRFFIYFIVSIVFIAFILNIIIYNYIVVKDSMGVISGNSIHYVAPYDGYIKNIYVKVGDTISKKELLFEMETNEYEQKIKILNNTQKILKERIAYLKQELLSYKDDSRKKLAEFKKVSSKEIKALKNEYEEQQKTYKKVKFLYDHQLISFKEFAMLQAQYQQFMNRYNSVVNKDFSNSKEMIALKQMYMKDKEQMLSINNSIDSLAKEIQKNELELENLRTYLKKSLIYSHSRGVVYSVNSDISQNVKYGQSILLVQTDKQAFILTKALSDEISSIELGSKVLVYSKKNNKIYEAHITGIGYPSIDGIDVGAQELSQNEIPIKIEFDNKNIKFNLNEYVELYILNSSKTAHFFFEHIVKEFI